MIFFEESRSVLMQIQGRMDSESSASLQQQLALIPAESFTLWVLDLAHVEFIDSAGLVSLVVAQKAANKHQCRLVICNLRPELRLIFEISQIDRVFEILDGQTEPTALCAQNLSLPKVLQAA